MPVQRPERGLGVERAHFREHRLLALAAGLAVGMVATATGVRLAAIGWETALCLFAGAAGTTYYSLHYDDLLPDEATAFERQFVQNAVVGWAVLAAAPEELPFVHRITLALAFLSVFIYVRLSTAAQVRGADD